MEYDYLDDLAELEPDLEMAKRFLRALDPNAEKFTFQTFDDNWDRKLKNLPRAINATFAEAAPILTQLNRQGAGVFVTVNETNLRGRTLDDMISIRAIWQEDDEGVNAAFPIEPQIVVESSPNKFHRYFLVDFASEKTEFRTVQQHLVDHYRSDPSAKDLSRVLRLPGFYHTKFDSRKSLDGTPHMVELISTQPGRYQWSDVKRAFGVVLAEDRNLEPVVDHPEVFLTANQHRELRSALMAIPADDQWEWIEVGMALKCLGQPGKELWRFWSQTSNSFDQAAANDIDNRWPDFKSGDHGNGVGFRTIFDKAQKYGWINPASNEAAKIRELSAANDELIGDRFPRFDPLNFESLQPYEWVIDQFVTALCMVFAGTHGVGKTNALVTLSMVATGLVSFGDVRASTPRKVVYIAEDPEQVSRICYALIRAHGIPMDQFNEYFRVHDGRRLPVAMVANECAKYGELEREIICPNGVAVTRPLIVIDTTSATIKMESENDNSEVSDVVATLREAYTGPLWLVGHIAKGLKRADVSDMSMRGGGAFEADAQGVFYMFSDEKNKNRYIYGGSSVKRRDEGSISELKVEAEFDEEQITDKFGFAQTIRYLTPSLSVSSVEQREQEVQERKAQEKEDKRNAKKSTHFLLLRSLLEDYEQRRVDNPSKPENYPSKAQITEDLNGSVTTHGLRELFNEVCEEVQVPGFMKLKIKRPNKTYIGLVKKEDVNFDENDELD